MIFEPALAAHPQTYPWSYGLLRPIVKIPYQGTDSLTGLKCEAEMIYQSLKGLFALRGQAQKIFYFKPCMLRGIVFY